MLEGKKANGDNGTRNLVILHRALQYVVAFLGKLGNFSFIHSSRTIISKLRFNKINSMSQYTRREGAVEQEILKGLISKV